jgi:hypothetical protein
VGTVVDVGAVVVNVVCTLGLAVVGTDGVVTTGFASAGSVVTGETPVVRAWASFETGPDSWAEFSALRANR